MGGKSGKKTETSRPADRAASSAQESGPLQPPDIIMEPWESDRTKPWISGGDENFREPIIPIRIIKDDSMDKQLKSRLHHHRFAFMGCFSCRLRKNIDYKALLQWKEDPQQAKTNEIAEILIPNICNYYDFITTAPPSQSRNIDNYCCFKLCENISAVMGIPFVISFVQRKRKRRHGWHASLEAELPILVPNWNYSNKAILFIDDFLTSGNTAKTCFDILHSFNNHVDGLIYCRY